MIKKCFSGVQHIDPKTCPYCNFLYKDGVQQNPEDFIDIGFFFKDERQSEKFVQTEIRAGIQLTNKTNKLSVDFRCDGNSSYSQFEYIHFCPMCGRDLFTF